MELEANILALNRETAYLFEHLGKWDDSKFDPWLVEESTDDYVETIQNDISLCKYGEAYNKISTAIMHPNISSLSSYRLIYYFLVPWLKKKGDYRMSEYYAQIVIDPLHVEKMIKVSSRKKLAVPREKVFDFITTIWNHAKEITYWVNRYYHSLKPKVEDYEFLKFFYNRQIIIQTNSEI